MKKFILILISSLITFNLYAVGEPDAKNIIALSPLQSYSGIKLKYERKFSDQYTAGSFLCYYYFLFYGVQAEPFLRFYLKETAPRGIYLQAKISSGYYTRHYMAHLYDEKGEYKKDARDYFMFERKKFKFPYSAVALSFGGQVFFGAEKRWSFDANVGLRYSQELPSLPSDVSSNHLSSVTEFSWLLFGPNALLDGIVSFGYRF